MATRTRIILTLEDGQRVMGSLAVKRVIARAAEKGLMLLGFPPNWPRMSKRQRLEHLAGYLPPGCSLQLFQEPKHTRKSRSAYWRAFAEKVLPRVVELDVVYRPQQRIAPLEVAAAQAHMANMPPDWVFIRAEDQF